MVAISANMSAFVCHDDALFRAYIYGTLVWSALALVLGVSEHESQRRRQLTLQIALIYYSSRGTMLNPEPRRHVASILLLRTMLAVAEFVWVILGTLLAFRGDESCQTASTVDDDDQEYFNLLQAVVITAWIVFIVRDREACFSIDQFVRSQAFVDSAVVGLQHHRPCRFQQH